MKLNTLDRARVAVEELADIFKYDPWRILAALVDDNIITEMQMEEILESMR